MGTITEIERAVERLDPAELAKFRQWFAEFDAAKWDQKIENDVAAGRLNALADEAIADHDDGRCRDL